jgi:hypothetical protein
MGGAAGLSLLNRQAEQRYVAWFHELDAWTEYWDIYHPETRGRYNFGDGKQERGLLTRYLPRDGRPPTYTAWRHMALWGDTAEGGSAAACFASEVRVPEVSAAVTEVDDLLARLFAKHFGDAADPAIQADYLQGIFRFAINSLPPALERDARIASEDPRKSTAGYHTLAGDIMWFSWALQLEAAHTIAGGDAGQARRALMLAGVAAGCPADFAWHGHRRTRPEYRPDEATATLLHERGLRWASDFEAAAQEIHVLFRIREWGSEY